MKKPTTFGERILRFYMGLRIWGGLPAGIRVMNPHQNPKTARFTAAFLRKFYGDNRRRVAVFGINPGRFGAGLTGVTFTDPVALKTFCGIPNDLPQKREMSAEFIYAFINLFGGARKFYKHFFLTAVSPLGFIKNGNNYNFYDDNILYARIKQFIVTAIQEQLRAGVRDDVAILLGTGKLKNVFAKLNSEHKFFAKTYAVEHPRFIMQYQRKNMHSYLEKYRRVFLKVLKNTSKKPCR